MVSGTLRGVNLYVVMSTEQKLLLDLWSVVTLTTRLWRG